MINCYSLVLRDYGVRLLVNPNTEDAFLCFLEIMILEQTIDTEPVTAYDVQAYFNSTQSK